MRKYIEIVPSFDEMADLREEIKSLLSALSGLAHGHDVIQRATDLCRIVDDVRKSVHNLCTEQRLIDDDDQCYCTLVGSG